MREAEMMERISQSMPNLAFIGLDEPQWTNEVTYSSCCSCQTKKQQEWTIIEDLESNSNWKDIEEDFYHQQQPSEMMDEGQENSEKGQRPLILGSFLLGVALSCFIYVNPSLMMIREMGVSKVNHLLALICVLAALTAPALAFTNRTAMVAVSIPTFAAFTILNHLKVIPVEVVFVAFGPFLAFIQWGQLLAVSKAKLRLWLQAASGWPHLIVAVVLQSKAVESLCLPVNILALALAGLCHLAYICSSHPKKAKVTTLEVGEVKRPKATKMAAPLMLYLNDNRVHMLLPMAFFIGLFEAFMAGNFVLTFTRTLLGLKGLSVILGILGTSKLISTWLTSQLHQVISTQILLAVLSLFQLALLLLLWLWQPSGDDPLVFYAITFVWGTTSGGWDTLILGSNGIGQYAEDPQDWKSAVGLLGLHHYVGMAVAFGLGPSPLVIGVTFIVTLVPFWCSSLKQ